MDLSHWDVIKFFTREQISQLLAGVDPNGAPYPDTVENKIALYRVSATRKRKTSVTTK